jgi:hypothetical protein
MYAKLVNFMLLSAGLLHATAFAQQQAFPDERYKIKLVIAGLAVSGGQELVARLAGKTPEQQYEIYGEPSPTLARGQSFQAEVTITDPAGASKDYTRSPRLRYEGFGCLTIASAGMVTATPVTGTRCIGPDSPELWVVLTDVGGNAIAMNSYTFRVTDTPPPRVKINPPNCRANPRLCS